MKHTQKEDNTLNIVSLLKPICTELGCFKTSYDNIITRCIYCGDSVKRKTNHGHFYIWMELPFCYCFRCGIRTKISKWLNDLGSFIDGEILTNIKNDIKNLYDTTFDYYNTIVYENEKIHILDLEKQSFDSINDILKNHLEARGLFDQTIIDYIKHEVLNLAVYKIDGSDDYFIGIKSAFNSGYHLRSINTSKTLQSKNISFDFYILGNNFLCDTIYAVEGLYDALSLIRLNNHLKIDIAKYSILVCSLSSLLKNMYYYIQLNNPEKIIFIYDSDVNKQMLQFHKKMSTYFFDKEISAKISFNMIKKDYKDLNDVIRNVPINECSDYIVSV